MPKLELVCAIALLREDGAVVLQHRDDKPTIAAPNTWVLPGGHRDGDETIMECAKREMQEETGYIANHLKHLLTMVDDFDPQRKPYELAVFWEIYDGRQEIKCFEGQAVKFVSVREASELKCSPFLFGLWELAWKRSQVGNRRLTQGNRIVSFEALEEKDVVKNS